ncbi:hypothetical protein Q8A73_009389 [Channa argus]|nr:hypothetical protein Q8A73_009389 [Channa argus]
MGTSYGLMCLQDELARCSQLHNRLRLPGPAGIQKQSPGNIQALEESEGDHTAHKHTLEHRGCSGSERAAQQRIPTAPLLATVTDNTLFPTVAAGSQAAKTRNKCNIRLQLHWGKNPCCIRPGSDTPVATDTAKHLERFYIRFFAYLEILVWASGKHGNPSKSNERDPSGCGFQKQSTRNGDAADALRVSAYRFYTVPLSFPSFVLCTKQCPTVPPRETVGNHTPIRYSSPQGPDIYTKMLHQLHSEEQKVHRWQDFEDGWKFKEKDSERQQIDSERDGGDKKNKEEDKEKASEHRRRV